MNLKKFDVPRENGGIMLSEQARNDTNSFWQTQKGISSAGSGNTNIYMKRMKVMVGSLGAIIFLLAGTLVFVAVNSNFNLSTTQQSLAPVQQVPVLLAKENISMGTLIHEGMLEIKEVPANSIPGEAFLGTDMPRVVNTYAARLIPAGGAVRMTDVRKESFQNNPFKIPAGYRAVTLNVDGRTGIEGFARPGTRVDVLWFYSAEDNQKKVTTVVSGAKVLSLGGTTSAGQVREPGTGGGITTATLLVTKKEAHVIELSRNLGNLSLSLVGDEESAAQNEDIGDYITVNDILKEEEVKKEEPVEGTVEVTDPRTGKKSSFVLTNNRLKRAPLQQQESLFSMESASSVVEAGAPEQEMRARMAEELAD